MTGDRGQALVLAVIALALAAATIVGLRTAQDRILADVRERRAGEAAVEAAGAALADAQVELLASLHDETGGPRSLASRDEIDALAGDPLVIERSRLAASELSAANDGPAITDLTITAATRTLDISLLAGRHRQAASIGAACCRP